MTTSHDNRRADILPPTTADIVALAEAALEDIPDVLRRPIAGLAIRVEDFADDETLDEMGLESRSTCWACMSACR